MGRGGDAGACCLHYSTRLLQTAVAQLRDNLRGSSASWQTHCYRTRTQKEGTVPLWREHAPACPILCSFEPALSSLHLHGRKPGTRKLSCVLTPSHTVSQKMPPILRFKYWNLASAVRRLRCDDCIWKLLRLENSRKFIQTSASAWRSYSARWWYVHGVAVLATCSGISLRFPIRHRACLRECGAQKEKKDVMFVP